MPAIDTVLGRFAERRHAPVAYLIALIVTAIAIAARGALQPVIPGFIFVTLYPAVLISAALGGLWAGIMSATLGGLAAWYLFGSSASSGPAAASWPWSSVVAFAA